MRKSKGEQSERKEWNLQWDDSETETIMFFQPLAGKTTAKQRGRGCEEGRQWFEPSRSYLPNTPTVTGGSDGYVSAAAPGSPDGEGGVKAPFSTAAGDGEDDNGEMEVRMGALLGFLRM
ncbi:hypothetical protein PIB30_094772 [Stylosanthes scabra]|uniref:Uncharacterized protein n=1 Tax=Stylosanthes scabra TaxID=79078 RepID=A0ABU6TW71_9FABA|nr:hypothetical protein [Stylosanthes scabra]